MYDVIDSGFGCFWDFDKPRLLTCHGQNLYMMLRVEFRNESDESDSYL